MRIRRKKWAEEELKNSEFYINNPETNRNKWNSIFKNKTNPIHIELGCGKGSFIANLASKHEDINYIAVDMIEAMLGLSKRNIEVAYDYKTPNNLFLIRANIEQINKVFGENDIIERIYINFCNPWPRSKHNKRRLTHPRQLQQYKQFLKEKGEIYFKTDNDELFSATLEYLKDNDFEIISKTYNLHKEPIFNENIETEHEKMFSEQGIDIKALIAVYNP